MDEIEEKFRELEREVDLQGQAAPVIDSVNSLTGWKKIGAVIAIGLVLFTIVKVVVNLLVAVLTVGLMGLIVYVLYRVFFQTPRSV